MNENLTISLVNSDKAAKTHTHSDCINRNLGATKSWADQYHETGIYFHRANSSETAVNSDYLPYLKVNGNTGDGWLVRVSKVNNTYSINEYFQPYTGLMRYGICLIDHVNAKRYWYIKSEK